MKIIKKSFLIPFGPRQNAAYWLEENIASPVGTRVELDNNQYVKDYSGFFITDEVGDGNCRILTMYRVQNGLFSSQTYTRDCNAHRLLGLAKWCTIYFMQNVILGVANLYFATVFGVRRVAQWKAAQLASCQEQSG